MINKLHYSIDVWDVTQVSPKLTDDQNCLIEGMEDYLSIHAPFFTNNDLGPFSIQSLLSINLPLAETLAGRSMFLRYARISSYSDASTKLDTFYYFVTGAQRLANNTIKISLKMDVLNTFSSKIESAFTSRTLVQREHRDRFQQKSFTGYPRTLSLVRSIDRVSEGITPVKHVIQESNIYETASCYKGSYYLLYKTRKALSETDLDNPVTCFLCADDEMIYQKGASGSVKTFKASDLIANEYHYILFDNNASGYITCTNYPGQTFRLGTLQRIIVYYSNGTNLLFVIFSFNDDGTITREDYNAGSSYTISLWEINKVYNGSYITSDIDAIKQMPFDYLLSGTSGDIVCIPFSAVKRTDSKYLKIIKLPYAPVPRVVASDGSVSFTGFKFDLTLGLFYIDDVTIDFVNRDFPYYSLSDIFSINGGTYDDADHIYLKSSTLKDSKIYHSDFFAIKFNYDNFALTIPLEMVTITDSDPVLAIAFKPTNTINSNFAFRFTPSAFKWEFQQDYQNYLLSSRNNEMPIFSNAYIDYIKTGYNYDKKSKAISSTFNWLGAATSMIGGAAAAAFGTEPFTKATGIGLAISGFSAMSGALSTSISAERDLNQKLAELKEQSTTTSGVDDIDLLSWYSENKLRSSRWQSNDYIVSMLNKMFYYYGYQTGVQKDPSLNSRVWFNYLQCVPYWNPSILNVYPWAIDEITQKFKDGVTIYHENIVVGNNNWDISQTKENWEKWIVA